MESRIKDFLTQHDIIYVLHEHKPVFTCEDAEIHCRHIPGLACKNLFLKDNAGRFYLVVLSAEKRLDNSAFRRLIGVSKLAFGNEQELFDVLRLNSGAVSPFGLINDIALRTTLFIDQAVWDADVVTFHPDNNAQTLELSCEMFRKAILLLQHQFHILSL